MHFVSALQPTQVAARMEVEILKHEAIMQRLNKRIGRSIIPDDAPLTYPSGEYRMLPPKSSTSLNYLPALSHLINPSTTLETFTRVAELPAELRLKIWRYSFPGPRIVRVNSYSIVKKDGYNFHTFYSTSTAPIALSICSESRMEALRHFHASFGMRYPSIPSTIYFNYEIDTLYFEFDSHQALNSQMLIFALPDRYGQVDGRVGMKYVQSMAVSHRTGMRKWRTLFRYLTRFENLREFVIGAERESPPVPADAVLEEADGNDESLKGLRNLLHAARENECKEILKEDCTDRIRMGVSVWKIMGVRRRTT